MKILKAVVTIVFIVACMAIAQDSYSADNEKPSTMDVFQMQENILDKLGISAEQKRQLDADRIKNKQDMMLLVAQMLGYREALRVELIKSNLDMKKIDEIQAGIKAVQNQTTDKRLEAVINVRKIMTHDQFVKFIELSEMRKAERSRRTAGARK